MRHCGQWSPLPKAPPPVFLWIRLPLSRDQRHDGCHMSSEALSTTSHKDRVVKRTLIKSPTVLLCISVYVRQWAVESCTAGASVWRHPISMYFHTLLEKNNPGSLIVSDHLLLRRNEMRLDESPPQFHPDRPPPRRDLCWDWAFVFHIWTDRNNSRS